ncbi:MAG: ribulose 1,5-bisphosphate carboxylase small subunit [Betaproteobacteria bacterium RIFCSPLOWO2_02_67_12]|nr:MAG: ribulose 1,5-bisphosphate carboxylase small subunit [Betaproteobacteria bacterium RIFCSPLOWO2_02_67_12]OGA29621.1 MAG: ribulose 1,5-bisphosphate carboxylase small subunit [Betaproteobacteria bacterium RIFCSPLOWO2_02_FULL_68_150]OGA72339.1 MAG: ribulose 1,5-bisphosphate carboxylase small subunit [Betaproteobacteria bacterium RIFCSPLOWO2_12_FULL_67_28]
MKHGTFSYLPPMTHEQLRRQVEYIVARGWNAALEHAAPEHATGTYWILWKLPMFGERSVERILAEAAACRKAHPAHLVRLIGYDNRRQTLGAALLVHHA